MSDVAAAQEHSMDTTGSMPGVGNRKFGMWLFLASEIMFFTALIGMFIAYRGRPGGAEFLASFDIPLTAVNTFLLLASSFTVVMSIAAVQAGRQGLFKLALLATAILGTTFVSIQAIEYSRFGAEGFGLSTNATTGAFFLLTGFHGMHVILGVLWCLAVLIRALRGGFGKENYLGVELFGLYWHFVDVVWIILFTVIYLLR
jgi:heme/copper-type cytochrome/quinol oxidase subunit 3